jgi:nucleoid-associated protein YgaU
VLTKVSQQFTKFLESGAPVRARLSVSFSEFIDEEREAKEVNRQTADFTKTHVVTGRETLSMIAARYYEDPKNWRPIAIVNDIDDPRALEPGQSLIIPSLPFGGVVGAS